MRNTLKRYQTDPCEAGFATSVIEKHDGALHEIVQPIRGKLLAAEVMIGMKSSSLPRVDFAAAKKMATNEQVFRLDLPKDRTVLYEESCVSSEEQEFNRGVRNPEGGDLEHSRPLK